MSRRPRDTASARSHTNLRPLAIAITLAIAIGMQYRKTPRLSNIVLGNSLGGRTELLTFERS